MAHDRRRPLAARQLKADRDRARHEGIAGGIHQHQCGHALGRTHGGGPRHLATERVAGQHRALDAKLVHQRQQIIHIAFDAVVAIGRRAGQTEAAQVHADHAFTIFKRYGPAIPGVQTGRGAVDQDQWQRILAQSFVAHVHLHAVDAEEHRGRRRPACSERFQRPIRLPGPKQHQAQREQRRRTDAQQYSAGAAHAAKRCGA